MNVHCPRDPLTCKCYYHQGYMSTHDGRDGPTVFADRFREGEGPYSIRPLAPDPVTRGTISHDEAAARIKAGVYPEPKCPYRHPAGTRCPNCENWPRFDRPYASAIADISKDLDIPATEVVRSVAALKSAGLLREGWPEPPPHLPRRATRWAAMLAMFGAGAALMFAEGQRQPAPGVWFAVALVLWCVAAVVGVRK